MAKKADLPGTIYLNGRRYWWKVKLPGEAEAKARLLKLEAQGYATKSLDVAESIARELYAKAVFSIAADGGDVGTVAGLVRAYLAHAKEYYQKSNEAYNIKISLADLVEMYGSERTDEMTPAKLKKVQRTLIDKRLTRSGVNRRICVIKRMYKWGVVEFGIPVSVAKGLMMLENLKRGRSAAKETQPIKPVPEIYIHRILPYATPTVAAMIELQLLTGMRSSELCQMRPVDIDSSGAVWLYRPKEHKSEYRGYDKMVAIGPKGQNILKPFLKRTIDAYCFSPEESAAQGRQRRAEKRVTPKGRGNWAGTNRKKSPKIKPGDRYDRVSYRQAVCRAIRAARGDGQKVVDFTPHRIRHTTATKIRKAMGVKGLEAASVTLGHKDLNVTQLYAESNRKLAEEVARKMG